MELRNGYLVTFGVPIIRNSESFAPATIKVGISHESAGHRSPVPGSTFALPEYVDDESSCSSSDNESEEPEEELIGSYEHGQNLPAGVELTKGRQEVDMVDLTDKDMPGDMGRSDADGLIDLTSPPRAVSPDMDDDEEDEDQENDDRENDEELRVMHATAMILDKIVDNQSDRDAASIASLSSQDSDVEPEEAHNINSDSGSDVTDSEMGIADDRSDDDEGNDSENEKGDWDAEYSSDDDVLDEGKPLH